MIKFHVPSRNKKGDNMLKTFVCQVCNHIAFNEAPVDCPVCGSAIENFENVPDAIMSAADPENLSDFEKKHIPSIRLEKACTSDSGGACTDVHVKVGEIEHVIESEHFINFIDLYIDRKYFSRTVFTPKKIYPWVHLHVNADKGMFSVIAHCNVHGSWCSKVKLDKS
jgi:superoxide reductase